MKALLITWVAVALSACTFTPHEVAVAPRIEREQSSIGQGTTIALGVFDDRPSTVVGQRGAGMIGADITAGGLLPGIDRTLAAGLEDRGFTVVHYDQPADVELEARLRGFEFFTEYGFWSGAENVSVAIGVEAERGADDYERTYRLQGEDRALFVAAGSEIDEGLNAALSHVLGQILNDRDLISFLADTPGAGMAPVAY